MEYIDQIETVKNGNRHYRIAEIKINKRQKGTITSNKLSTVKPPSKPTSHRDLFISGL